MWDYFCYAAALLGGGIVVFMAHSVWCAVSAEAAEDRIDVEASDRAIQAWKHGNEPAASTAELRRALDKEVAHASRFNHLRALGVEEVRPFIPPANPATRPELTPEQEAAGWSIIDAGGMWVKTIDIDQVKSITIHFKKKSTDV